MRVFVEHNARAKPVEVELPQDPVVISFCVDVEEVNAYHIMGG
jgi:hypothetical protein